MVAVIATDLLEAIYYTVKQEFFEYYLGIVVSLAICISFVGGNHMFLWMMVRRSLVGVRAIIMCNLMFSVSMLADLILLVCEYTWSEESVEKESGFNLIVLIFKLLERLACVAFFVVATFIYARLWSLYRYDGRSLGRRLCQILPALLAAAAICGLMLFGECLGQGNCVPTSQNGFEQQSTASPHHHTTAPPYGPRFPVQRRRLFVAHMG
mmetsp:Transcript_67220/g.185188  ORF Transcript_67220/g.185188 Transcript_67220/m.185188 type:complete len:210 (-) Transcript_67220:197-826(-)